MANPVVEFILKMNSAAFTKGVAAANNSVKGLKKELHEGGGAKFGHVLGVAGIVEGFRAIVGHASEARDKLVALGQAIPENIASVAALGDGFKALKNGIADAAVAGLSFFTKMGESIGSGINSIRSALGEGLADPDIAAKAAAGAEAAEARLLAVRNRIAAANDPSALADKDRKLAESRRKHALDEMNDWNKLNALVQERASLEKEIARWQQNAPSNQAKIKDKQQELEDLNAQISSAKKKSQENATGDSKTLMAASMSLDKAKAAKEDFFLDPYKKALPTVAGLASERININQGKKHDDAVLAARESLRLQNLADTAGFSGNMPEALRLNQLADKARAGTSGFAQSDERDKSKELADNVNLQTETLKIIQQLMESRTLAATP